MGPAWWILVILCRRHRDFAVAAYQDHEHCYPRADFVPGCSRGRGPRLRPAFGRGRRPRSAPAATTYSFRRDRVASLYDLVLACVSNCAEILSPSLLRRRRDPNRVFLLVLAHCTTD